MKPPSNTEDLLARFRKDRNQKFEEKLRFLKQYIELAKSMNGHQTIVEFYLEKNDASSLRDFFSDDEKLSLGITNNFRHENNRYPVRIILERFEKYLQERQDKGFADVKKNHDADGINNNNNNNNTTPPVVENTNRESIKELLQQVESTIGSVEVTPIVPSNMTQPSLDGYGTQYETQQSDSTSTNSYDYGTQYATPQSYPTSTNAYGYGTQYETQYETQYVTPQSYPTSTNLSGYGTQYATQYETQYVTPQSYPISTNLSGYEPQYGVPQSDPTFTETLVENNSPLIDHEQYARDLGILAEYRECYFKLQQTNSRPQYSAQTNSHELYFSAFQNTNQNDNNNRKSTHSNKKRQKLKSSEYSNYSNDPDKTESESDNDFEGKRKLERGNQSPRSGL